MNSLFGERLSPWSSLDPTLPLCSAFVISAMLTPRCSRGNERCEFHVMKPPSGVPSGWPSKPFVSKRIVRAAHFPLWSPKREQHDVCAKQGETAGQSARCKLLVLYVFVERLDVLGGHLVRTWWSNQCVCLHNIFEKTFVPARRDVVHAGRHLALLNSKVEYCASIVPSTFDDTRDTP